MEGKKEDIRETEKGREDEEASVKRRVKIRERGSGENG